LQKYKKNAKQAIFFREIIEICVCLALDGGTTAEGRKRIMAIIPKIMAIIL
jgi:hypothetical protein